MSTTATKRPYSRALADAEAFRDLFPATTWERWEIAGSIRRRKPEIGDCEHVVIPKFGDIAARDLFATPQRVNLLWHWLDSLVAGRQVSKHLYGAAEGYRWGEKYRGADFNGFNHEIFTADADNFGSVLAIRTGPADFSRRLVMGLLRQQRRNKDGYVWECVRCACEGKQTDCRSCDGTSLEPVTRLTAESEAGYFDLCGVRWIKPEGRQ